jgi:hypothetical protein
VDLVKWPIAERGQQVRAEMPNVLLWWYLLSPQRFARYQRWSHQAIDSWPCGHTVREVSQQGATHLVESVFIARRR